MLIQSKLTDITQTENTFEFFEMLFKCFTTQSPFKRGRLSKRLSKSDIKIHRLSLSILGSRVFVDFPANIILGGTLTTFHRLTKKC